MGSLEGVVSGNGFVVAFESSSEGSIDLVENRNWKLCVLERKITGSFVGKWCRIEVNGGFF